MKILKQAASTKIYWFCKNNGSAFNAKSGRSCRSNSVGMIRTSNWCYRATDVAPTTV